MVARLATLVVVRSLTERRNCFVFRRRHRRQDRLDPSHNSAGSTDCDEDCARRSGRDDAKYPEAKTAERERTNLRQYQSKIPLLRDDRRGEKELQRQKEIWVSLRNRFGNWSFRRRRCCQDPSAAINTWSAKQFRRPASPPTPLLRTLCEHQGQIWQCLRTDTETSGTQVGGPPGRDLRLNVCP